jgi:hypothetical protein
MIRANLPYGKLKDGKERERKRKEGKNRLRE